MGNPIVSVRLTPGQKATLEKRAREYSSPGAPCTVSDVLRTAANTLRFGRPHLAAMALFAKDRGDQNLAALIAFLGLPPNATVEDIRAAIENLIAPPPEPGTPAAPTAGNADAPPNPTFGGTLQPKAPPAKGPVLASLTAIEQRHAAEIKDPEARARYIARRCERAEKLRHTAARKGAK